MAKNEVVEITGSLISNHFGLEPFHQDNITEEVVFQKLLEVVQYLLNNDLNKLLNILYRIDLSEDAINKILVNTEPDEIAKQLAIKILEREYLKAKTRLRYSQ